MATLGDQRIQFESVRRLGYCHPMAIFFLSFLCFAEASAFSGTSSFRNDPPASNLAAINALLAAITDMLHLWRQWMWHSAPVLWQNFLLVPMDVNVFTLYVLSDNRWKEGCEAHNVSVEPVTNLMYDRSGTTWLSPIGSTGNSQTLFFKFSPLRMYVLAGLQSTRDFSLNILLLGTIRDTLHL